MRVIQASSGRGQDAFARPCEVIRGSGVRTDLFACRFRFTNRKGRDGSRPFTSLQVRPAAQAAATEASSSLLPFLRRRSHAKPARPEPNRRAAPGSGTKTRTLLKPCAKPEKLNEVTAWENSIRYSLLPA